MSGQSKAKNKTAPRNNMKKFFILLIVLTSLVVGASTALCRETGPVTLTVVATNDFHGALLGKAYGWSNGNTVGGAAWLAGYLDAVRKENPGGVLYVDSGDLMQGSFVSRYYDGVPAIAVLNAMGLQAAGISNHEFDWGQEVLAERVKQARFPLLSANIRDKKTGKLPKWAKAYTIVEVQGVKVGIIGVTNPNTPNETLPKNIAGLEFTNPARAVDTYLPEMERQGATVVVVLANIGGTPPSYPEGILDFTCSLNNSKVDMVVSGNTHNRIADELCGIPVVQAGSQGVGFSRVDFTVNRTTGEVEDFRMNSAPMIVHQDKDNSPPVYRRWDNRKAVEVLPDPKVEAIVDRYEVLIAAIKNTVLGETKTAITRDARHESAMGDWVTDIMRESTLGVDFAMINGGALRADIDAGKITYGEVYDTLIFGDTLVVSKLSGYEVRQALEQGVSGKYKLVQVSGLKFTFDYDMPPFKRIKDKVINTRTGNPLAPDKIYSVVINNYMASGGDGFGVLRTNPKTKTDQVLRDLVMDWIKAHTPITAPDPATEKRITDKGLPPRSQKELEDQEKRAGFGQ
jgi:2',3'-cyclic-nucleotide 2'-phosphodiesterase (5'-nucleotidase family)